MKKHFDYVQPILEWAEERELLENGRLTKQLLKSTEEVLELCRAIESYEHGNSEQLEEIKDAIGDVYVTLVIAVELAKLKHNTQLVFERVKPFEYECVELGWGWIISKVKRMDNLIFANLVSTYKVNATMPIAQYINLLSSIAKHYSLELVDCIELAYNTISKRKGSMIDGSFVKEG